jgi:4'-phosphopantetheinyl transferase
MSRLIACSTLDVNSEHATALALRHGIESAPEPGRPAMQRRSRLARALLQEMLADDFGTGPWTLSADSRGKPFIEERATDPSFGVSIAHGDDIVAAAVSTIGTVGVDVEPHRTDRDLLRIAEYAFGCAEQGRTAAGGARQFYRTWTLREAMGKATGDGLALAADGIDRTTALPEEGAWTQEEGAWLLAHRFLQDRQSLALAVRRDPGADPAAWSFDAISWRGLVLASVAAPMCEA